MAERRDRTQLTFSEHIRRGSVVLNGWLRVTAQRAKDMIEVCRLQRQIREHESSLRELALRAGFLANAGDFEFDDPEIALQQSRCESASHLRFNRQHGESPRDSDVERGQPDDQGLLKTAAELGHSILKRDEKGTAFETYRSEARVVWKDIDNCRERISQLGFDPDARRLQELCRHCFQKLSSVKIAGTCAVILLIAAIAATPRLPSATAGSRNVNRDATLSKGSSDADGSGRQTRVFDPQDKQKIAELERQLDTILRAQASLSSKLEQQEAANKKSNGRLEVALDENERLVSRVSNAQNTLRSEVRKQSETRPVIQLEPPRISIPREPPKKSADLIIKSVSVSYTKSNGKSWDGSDGNPDLKVFVRVKGLFGTSSWTDTKRDTFSASFNTKAIRVTEGDTIVVEVHDEDFLDDDLVGSYEKKITTDTINAQGQTGASTAWIR